MSICRSLASLSAIVILGAAAPALAGDSDDSGTRRDAAQVTRDGTFLPLTWSPRVGDQRVSGVFTGGYDSAPGQGAVFSGVVEGALYNRLALRVGVEYGAPTNSANPSVGFRLGILRQERYGVDLGVGFQYRNVGFSEAKGEFEMMVMVARRWNRLALFGNAVFGVGLDAAERDGEVRVGAMYAVHDRVNVGLDARARFDLGEETALRKMNKLENEFDLIAGPMATVAAGPVMLLAHAGVHTLVQNEQPLTGVIAVGGVGAAF